MTAAIASSATLWLEASGVGQRVLAILSLTVANVSFYFVARFAHFKRSRRLLVALGVGFLSCLAALSIVLISAPSARASSTPPQVNPATSSDEQKLDEATQGDPLGLARRDRDSELVEGARHLSVDDSVDYWRDILKEDADRPTVWSNYLEALRLAGRNASLFDTAGEALERFPEDANLWAKVANILIGMGNAGPELLRYPDEPSAFMLLQEIEDLDDLGVYELDVLALYWEVHGGDPTRAESHLRRSIGLDPGSIWSTTRLGYWLYDRPGYYDRGAQVLREGLAHRPGRSEFWSELLWLERFKSPEEKRRIFLMGMAVADTPVSLARGHVSLLRPEGDDDAKLAPLAREVDAQGWRAANKDILIIAALVQDGLYGEAVDLIDAVERSGRIEPLVRALWVSDIWVRGGHPQEALAVLRAQDVELQEANQLRGREVSALLSLERVDAAFSVAGTMAEWGSADGYRSIARESTVSLDARLQAATSAAELGGQASDYRLLGDVLIEAGSDSLASESYWEAVSLTDKTAYWTNVRSVFDDYLAIALKGTGALNEFENVETLLQLVAKDLRFARVRRSVANRLIEFDRLTEAAAMLDTQDVRLGQNPIAELGDPALNILEAANMEWRRWEISEGDEAEMVIRRAADLFRRATEAGFEFDEHDSLLRARSFAKSGADEEALLALNALIESDAEFALLYSERARVHERLGQSEESLADDERARSLEGG